ncbi:uncharacterized protein [Aristolochia californica]|uniref:uncharacterized protein n=1 Tax=Aristolochia californica TaxID=171875 RepID=UPI0035D78121
METTLGLQYRFLYTKPFFVRSKLTSMSQCRSFSFHRSSLVFPTLNSPPKQSNQLPPLTPPVVNCFLTSSRYNKDDEDEHKGNHGLGASVFLACILGAICLSGRTCPPALAFQFFAQERSLSMRSLSLASLRSGKEALEGLLDVKKARLDPKSLETAESEFQQLLKQENFDPHELQKVVWKLEMSGKEDKVVKTLQEMYDTEIRKRHPDRAYELGLHLVEMRIYQGNYLMARRLCNQLEQQYMEQEKWTTDARPSLYLAVTNLMLGDINGARERWKMFTEIHSRIRGETGLIASEHDPEETERSLTFEEFKEHMEVLKREIAEARKN